MKLNYVAIPVITGIVATAGSYITTSGMDWYHTLNLPSYTPPGAFIGTVWTIIFILSALSALILWNAKTRGKEKQELKIWIAWVFALNAALNVGWSFIFFGLHFLGTAALEAVGLGLSVLLLMLLGRHISRKVAWLLAPYLAWVCFATYLTIAVWQAN